MNSCHSYEHQSNNSGYLQLRTIDIMHLFAKNFDEALSEPACHSGNGTTAISPFRYLKNLITQEPFAAEFKVYIHSTILSEDDSHFKCYWRCR